jgi:hypothetical protein
MYTDEPAPKKDVASGQNFSRFNPLTKITVFARLGYPTPDISQGSWNRAGNRQRIFFKGLHRRKIFTQHLCPKRLPLSRVGAAEKVLLGGEIIPQRLKPNPF